MNMENQKYQEMQNNENENITPVSIKAQDARSKKEHFRSRMKTQLTISNGVSLKQKLRSQQTVDFSVNKFEQIQDEYSFQYEELEKIGEAKTEYQIVKELNHDNILKVFEMFVNEKTGYVRLITEYSDGITLKKFIEKSFNKKLTEQTSAKITLQILSALCYLHQNKIVHRDVKPSNIIINPESLKVTLIDFGISRFFSDQQELCTPTGTPLYKAPEIIRGDPYNETADCWSLGITLFEMLTGLKPFNYTYRENEMIVKMENQSFINNSKYKQLSQQAQDLLRQLLNPNLYCRIQPQEGLKHPFVHRVQESQILCSQDLNIPFGSISELTPPKKGCQNESQNIYSYQSLTTQHCKASKRLTYSCGKNSHSFTEYLNTLNKQFTPLKNNKNIMNYSPQTIKKQALSKQDVQKPVLTSLSNITILRQISQN